MSKGMQALSALLAMAALLLGCKPSSSTAPAAQQTAPVEWDFAVTASGNVPAGWARMQTNPTDAWAMIKTIEDPTAPSPPGVLAVVESTCTGSTFNLALVGNRSFCDLELTVMVKAVSGTEDQGGGPVWRCRDQNHYYICRINPLEHNYRVYIVKEGKRTQLASADVELEAGRWYELRVTMRGSHIVCSLDGEEMLNVTDPTFTDAGLIGVWAKADAVTSFDDLSVQVLQQP